MTRPLGFIVSGKAAAVEPLLTSSGLRDRPSSLLCPRLTPAISRGSLLASAPAVADGLELQVSLSKDVNSCCTTGPFISGAERWAALRGASSPAPSTLYGLSVRRLISFDRWLPSHETSRFRSCFGLVLWAKLSPVMRASLTAFPYRGLSPHQFTPMSGAHPVLLATPVCVQLSFLRQWPGAPDQGR
jgi:hypothetical protein